MLYIATKHHHAQRYSLVNRGSNGVIAGKDVCIINKTGRQVDNASIGNHQIKDIQNVTAGIPCKLKEFQ